MSKLYKENHSNYSHIFAIMSDRFVSCDHAHGLQTTRSDRNGKYVTIWNKKIRTLICANHTLAAENC